MLTLIIYTSINSDLSFCLIISHGFHLYKKNPDRHGATALKNHPKRMRRKVSGSRQAQQRRFCRLTHLPNSAFLYSAKVTFRKTFKFNGNKFFHARPASSLPCFLFFAVLNPHHGTRQPPNDQRFSAISVPFVAFYANRRKSVPGGRNCRHSFRSPGTQIPSFYSLTRSVSTSKGRTCSAASASSSSPTGFSSRSHR